MPRIATHNELYSRQTTSLLQSIHDPDNYPDGRTSRYTSANWNRWLGFVEASGLDIKARWAIGSFLERRWLSSGMAIGVSVAALVERDNTAASISFAASSCFEHRRGS